MDFRNCENKILQPLTLSQKYYHNIHVVILTPLNGLNPLPLALPSAYGLRNYHFTQLGGDHLTLHQIVQLKSQMVRCLVNIYKNDFSPITQHNVTNMVLKFFFLKMSQIAGKTCLNGESYNLIALSRCLDQKSYFSFVVGGKN